MKQHCQVHDVMCWALCVQPAKTAPAHHSVCRMVLCTYLQWAADGNDPALIAANWKGLSLSQVLLQAL